jgi:hypothetical protein
MNKYFYVPVTSRHIKYDGKSLLDVTGAIDSKLKDRELGRVEMRYGDKTLDSSSLEMKKVLSQYNSETSLLYKRNGMPERLILIKDQDGVREMYTDNSLEVIPNYLECFEISALDVISLIESGEYFDLAINYFGMYNYRKKDKAKTNIKKQNNS